MKKIAKFKKFLCHPEIIFSSAYLSSNSKQWPDFPGNKDGGKVYELQ